MTQDYIRADHDYLLKMKKFSCTFNLESVDRITLSRLRYIRHNIISELEVGIDTKEELIRKKNLLTLVEFRLGDKRRAQELNDEVISLTNWENITSLGNRCYIMVSIGDEPEAKRCLKCLKKSITRLEVFDDLLTEAMAEQAYCYSRLGGSDNLRRAIDLFSQAVAQKPENYLWKFGLGLVYRRATHTNIYCSTTDRLDVEQFKFLAAKHLFDVGDNARNRNLRAMAYAQLVKLRQDHPSELNPHYDSLFRQNNIQQLCDRALEQGTDIPCVLTQCGRSLLSIDVDRAVHLLERSVAIKPNTIAFHNLGKGYKKIAERLAEKECGDLNVELVGTFDDDLHEWDESSVSHRPLQGNVISEVAVIQDKSCFGESLEHVNGHTHQICLSQSVSVKTKLRDKTKIHVPPDISNNEDTNSLNGDVVLHNSNLEVLVPSKRFFRSLSCDGISDKSTNVEELFTYGYACDGNKRQSALPHEYTAGRSTNQARVYNRSLSDVWSPRDEVKAFVTSSSISSGPLNKNDKFVQKAISSYKYAIELSNGENLPASLDLGIILKQTGQVREALMQFNSVTNSQLSLTGHRVTVISAYEQAGLCYLQLSKTTGMDNSFDKDGQKKLTKAISLAADLAGTISELKGCAHDVWVALRTLLRELDKGPHCPSQQKQKIQLLELVRDHGQVVEVVQKLRRFSENELNDQDVIRSALTSYLKIGQPEHALAFQNMLGIGHGVLDSLWWKGDEMRSLRAKVLLRAISGRLRETSDNPTYLFQQLFQLCHGSCAGLESCLKDEKTVRTNSGDLLVVFDEDQDTVKCTSRTTRAARYITHLSTDLFGLEAEENLQGTGEYGDSLLIQLKEMRRYKVVVLVLGGTVRNGLYDALLDRVPYNNLDSDSPSQRILVVDAGLKVGQVPVSLRQYECLRLEDATIPGDLIEGYHLDDEGDKFSFQDKRGLYKDVDAILKMFCFLIGQQWPCP